jgi:ribonuclease P protein component
MLPRAHRLKSDAHFKALARKGRSFFSPLLTMRALRLPQGDTQIGFVVSTKVSKSAVARNRIRRQLREIVRSELPKLGSGFQIMLVVKKQAIGTPYAKLSNEINKLFTDARIYRS